MESFLILSLGYDLNLMPIRTMVLQRCGYQVEEAFSCSRAWETASERSIDLVVICHSVPPDEQENLIEKIKLKRPDLPVLCLALPTLDVKAIGCTTACNTAPEFLEDVSNALPSSGTAMQQS